MAGRAKTPLQGSVADMKRLFRNYDREGDGTISQTELATLLEKIGGKFPNAKLKRLFDAIDSNHNGQIEYDEFIDFVFFRDEPEPEHTGPPVEQARALWTLWKKISPNDCAVPPSVVASQLHSAVVFAQDALPDYTDGDPKSQEARGPGGSQRGAWRSEKRRGAFNLFKRASSLETRQRIEAHVDGDIAGEDFVRLLWPSMKDAGVQSVLGLFRRFVAEAELREVFRAVVNKTPVHLSPAEVESMFQEIDMNDDGGLSVNELVQFGHLEKTESLRISELLDTKQQDGYISKEEVLSIVKLGAPVQESIKGLFAGSLA